MKHLFILAFALVLVAPSAHAKRAKARAAVATSSVEFESEKETRFSLTAEPLWLLLGGIGARADYAMTRRTSIGVGGIYIPERSTNTGDSSSSSSSTQYDYKWSYSEFNLGPTFMLTGDLSNNGVYINPAVGYVKSSITEFSSFKLQGSLASPQFRTTVGYQWINQNIRVALGGGYRLVQANDIVVKDAAGKEVLRERSSTLGGLALDILFGIVF